MTNDTPPPQNTGAPPAGWVVDPIQIGQHKPPSEGGGYVPTNDHSKRWVDVTSGKVYVPQGQTTHEMIAKIPLAVRQQQAAAFDKKYDDTKMVTVGPNTEIYIGNKDISKINSGGSMYLNPSVSGSKVTLSDKKENDYAIELNKNNVGGVDWKYNNSRLVVAPYGDVSISGRTTTGASIFGTIVEQPDLNKRVSWDTFKKSVDINKVGDISQTTLIFENPNDSILIDSRLKRGDYDLTGLSGKVYIAPTTVTKTGATTYDMTKKVDITNDPDMLAAQILKRDYGEPWTQIANTDYDSKKSYDAAKKQYDDYLAQTRRYQEYLDVIEGRKICLNASCTATADNPAYHRQLVQAEAAQRGEVVVYGPDGTPVSMKQSNYNALIANPAEYIKAHPGSLGKDLGLVPKSFYEQYYFAPKDVKAKIDAWLYDQWTTLKTGECWEKFRNGYMGNPEAYTTKLYTNEMDMYQKNTQQFTTTITNLTNRLNEMQQKYTNNHGEWIGSASTKTEYDKLLSDYNTHIKWRDTYVNNVQSKINTYGGMISIARKQVYNKKTPRTKTQKPKKQPSSSRHTTTQLQFPKITFDFNLTANTKPKPKRKSRQKSKRNVKSKDSFLETMSRTYKNSPFRI